MADYASIVDGIGVCIFTELIQSPCQETLKETQLSKINRPKFGATEENDAREEGSGLDTVAFLSVSKYFINADRLV